MPAAGLAIVRTFVLTPETLSAEAAVPRTLIGSIVVHPNASFVEETTSLPTRHAKNATAFPTWCDDDDGSEHARRETETTILMQGTSPTQPLTTTNLRNMRQMIGPMATDPSPDPGVVPKAAPDVHRGPGAVLGPVPAVYDLGRPMGLHPDPVPAPVPGLSPVLVPDPTPAVAVSMVNDRRARRHHHRQATPTISEELLLGRTPSGAKDKLRHR